MERLRDAEEQRIEWGLSESLGSRTPPDLTAQILSRAFGNREQDPSIGSTDLGTTPGSRRRGFSARAWVSALAVAAALVIVAWIAWLSRSGGALTDSDPDSNREIDRGRWATPQDRPLPPEVIVRNAGEAENLPADARNVKAIAFDDDEIRALSHLKGLERLVLAAQSFGPSPGAITDTSMAWLGTQTKLRELEMMYNKDVTSEGLLQLGRLPVLQKLKVVGTRMREDSILVFAKKLPSLRELDLWFQPVLGDAAVQILSRMRGLRRLALRSCGGVTSSGLRALGGLRELRELELSAIVAPEPDTPGRKPDRSMPPRLVRAVTDEVLLSFDGMTKLVSLRLGRSQVTEAGLAVLSKMTSLRRLDLDFSPLGDAALDRVPATVESLDVAGWDKLSDEALVKAVKRMAGLRELDISDCGGLTDAGVLEILGLRPFLRLELSGSPFTAALIEPLLAQRTLEVLRLEMLWVTEAMRTRLEALPKIRELATEIEETIEEVEVVPPPPKKNRR